MVIGTSNYWIEVGNVENGDLFWDLNLCALNACPRKKLTWTNKRGQMAYSISSSAECILLVSPKPMLSFTFLFLNTPP